MCIRDSLSLADGTELLPLVIYVSVYVHEPVNVLDVDVVRVLLLLDPQKINYIVQQIF